MPQMDYFRRPILAGKNVRRLTAASIRGSVRRNDPDGVNASPYFPGVSATQTLIVQTETSTYTATLTGVTLAQVILDVQSALGVNGTAFDSDGCLGLRTAVAGGTGFIQVTGGTAATALGYDVTLGRNLRASGGDFDSAPEGRIGNPFGVAFPGIGEDFKSEVFQRSLARLSANLDVVFADLLREVAEVQKVTGAVLDAGAGLYFTLPAATRVFNGYVSGSPVLTRLSASTDLAPFFAIVDATTKQLTPYKVTAVVIGTPSGSPPYADAASISDNSSPKNVLGLNLSKFGPTAITNIREGRVVTSTGAGTALVVGDIVQIASATNTNKWSNNGMKWAVEQIIDANNIVLRPIAQSTLTQLGVTLNDTQPVLELADNLSGSQSYGTLQGFTGSFTTNCSLVLNPPAPIAGSFEVWVAQPLSIRSRQSWQEQRGNTPFVQSQTPFIAGSTGQVPLAARRFSVGSTGNILEIQNQAGTAISRFGATGALVLAPDGTNTTAITATGTGTGVGVLGTGGATSSAGISGVGGAPNGTGVIGQGVGAGNGVFGQGGPTSGIGGSFQGGAPNGSAVLGQGTGTGVGGSFAGGSSGANGGVFTATGATSHGATGAGSGTGSGFRGTGGATGVGVTGIGGATSGDGVVGQGTAGNGRGGAFTGQGSGAGAQGNGGATGAGVIGVGGATSGNGGSFTSTTSGHGAVGTGAGGGVGFQGFGNGAGAGVQGNGGSSSGPGLQGIGGTANGHGVTGQGTGTGQGGLFIAGAGGNAAGLTATGNGTFAGVLGTGGATSGTGVQGNGGAPNGVGVFGQGAGTGNGVLGIGGTTSGFGVQGTGGPNSIGVNGTGTGTGAGIQGTGGATGAPGVLAVAGSGNTRGALNLASQATPSAPSNGDIWYNATDLVAQLAGVTEILAKKSYVDGAAVATFISTFHSWTASQTFAGKVTATGPTSGDEGIHGVGNASGYGVVGIGGSVGSGGYFQAGGPNSQGIVVLGTGTGEGGNFSSPSGPAIILGANASRGALRFTSQGIPSIPQPGDMWFDGTSILYRRNDGTTKTIAVV